MATETRPEQESADAGTTRAPNAYDQLIEAGRDRGYKLDWAIARDTLGQTLEANAEKGGLLLQDIDRGEAAEVPDWSNNQTGSTEAKKA